MILLRQEIKRRHRFAWAWGFTFRHTDSQLLAVNPWEIVQQGVGNIGHNLWRQILEPLSNGV